MAICCPKPVRAVAMRATLVDDCGIPVDTTTVLRSQIATSQFISLAFSPDILEGETFRQTTAGGNLCINDNEDCDKLLGLNLTLQMCGLPTHQVAMLTGGQSLVNAGGDTIGMSWPSTNFDSTTTGCANRVLLEVWSPNSDKSKCDTSGNVFTYVRWFIPQAFKWQMSGDATFSNDIFQLELSGYAEANTNFASPVGLANDPDLDQAMVDTIAAGGPISFLCTNTLPTTVECDFVNP